MESVSCPKILGLKLGCLGALGIITIASLSMICELFQISYPNLPTGLLILVLLALLVACPGIPFLVSFRAVRQSTRPGQGIIAGSLAAIIGIIGGLIAMMILYFLWPINVSGPSPYTTLGEVMALGGISLGVGIGIPAGLVGTFMGVFLACAVKAFARANKEKYYGSY